MRILPKYQNCQNCQYVQNYQITKFNKCSPKFQRILPLPVWLTDIHQLSILTKSPKMQNWTILQTLPKSLTLSKSQKLTKFQISPKLQTVWKGGNRQIKVDLVCRKRILLSGCFKFKVVSFTCYRFQSASLKVSSFFIFT